MLTVNVVVDFLETVNGRHELVDMHLGDGSQIAVVMVEAW